jgi:energy-coupling factor transporter ATP-binding protein EcfA2
MNAPLNSQTSHDELITYFAETDARNKRVKFGIKAKDRTRHVYVIGKTGMGKSTLLENMAVQDIKNGEGMAFIDPHGKTADLLLEYIPENRIKDVVYFAPFDLEHPVSFNVLESVDPDKRHLVVSGLMSTFKKIWVDAWSARMEYILTNTLLALLEYPEATLLGVNRMLSDKAFRNKVVACVTDPAVKSFWVDEFANYTERQAAEAVPAIQNKVGQFTANPLIRNMIGQPKSSFNIRELMDTRKIMIINLSKGRVGETNTNLLGGMLITKIYLAAMSRADLPDRVLKTMPNFYLFVDEFQNFANESFADILSEARKYKLNLTIAHQYIEQMEEEVAAAVFGNVGTMIVFRVGATDAEYLEKEFAPQFTIEDIVNLGFAQIYLKLMIDGISSQPFSATTLGPIPQAERAFTAEVVNASREQFSLKRADVEKAIADWMAPINPKNPVKAKSAAGGTSGVTATTGAAIITSTGGVSVTDSSQSKIQTVETPASVPTKPQQGSPSLKSALAAVISQQKPRITPSVSPTPAAPSSAPVASQSVPQVSAAPQQVKAPAPASKPVHKPFAAAGLGDLLKNVTETPVQKPVPVSSNASASSAPVAAPIPAVKPISLASLAQKSVGANQKHDGKTPTAQNINQLKAALASAMQKPQKQEALGNIMPSSREAGAKSEPRVAESNTVSQSKPPEVPQEVLERVLKVDREN